MKTIGIQGGEASYHEIAAQQMYGGVKVKCYETFPEVFAALRDKEVDSAIIAIANNAVGFITEPYSELVRSAKEFSIIGETYLRVEHALLVVPGTRFEDIQEVHSQSPALEQCREFLDTKMTNVHIVEEHDTAGSAKMVAGWKDSSKAAIASLQAGELYGLVPLKKNIQDDAANVTRFLEIATGPITKGTQKSNKTTMLLKTPERPGALVDALLPFKEKGINLSNLHSRFVPNTAFEMVFFMEFEAGLWSKESEAILDELRSKGYESTVLGTYKQAPVPLK